MTTINDLDPSWGEELYVLVRPAAGLSWAGRDDGILRDGGSLRLPTDRDWRPARITGFQSPGFRDWYGTANDPRNVWLIGNVHAHPFSFFDFGPVLDMADLVDADQPGVSHDDIPARL